MENEWQKLEHFVWIGILDCGYFSMLRTCEMLSNTQELSKSHIKF